MKEVAILMDLQVTEKGDQFLAHGFGPDEKDRPLSFAKVTNLDFLEISQFYQIYSVHAACNDLTVP